MGQCPTWLSQYRLRFPCCCFVLCKSNARIFFFSFLGEYVRWHVLALAKYHFPVHYSFLTEIRIHFVLCRYQTVSIKQALALLIMTLPLSTWHAKSRKWAVQEMVAYTNMFNLFPLLIYVHLLTLLFRESGRALVSCMWSIAVSASDFL